MTHLRSGSWRTVKECLKVGAWCQHAEGRGSDCRPQRRGWASNGGGKSWLRQSTEKGETIFPFPRKSGEMKGRGLHEEKIPEKRHYGLQPRFRDNSVLVILKYRVHKWKADGKSH